MLQLLFALVWLGICQGDNPLGSYRAAVYEHVVIVPESVVTKVTRQEALALMMKNLKIYRDQAKEAASQGARIIVFPEDGLYGMDFTRSAQEPYLEYIPDPKLAHWNPCQNPNRYPDTEVQHYLSCLAKDNSIYTVANMGDRQPCSEEDTDCPDDGYYMYNTDVAFDPSGFLVARYHKMHLFEQEKDRFQTSSEADIAFFDTPFARIGLFTCFDVLFHDPTLTLIETYHITDIAFPTAWFDNLPLFSSIQVHSAFAAGLGINFLSANLHHPTAFLVGSGIYSPQGALTYYHDSQSEAGRLLVSDVPILQPPYSTSQPEYNCGSALKYKYQYIPLWDVAADEQQGTNQDEFQSDISGDVYTWVTLEKKAGCLHVCHNTLCCSLEYKRSSGNDLFAFGAFDGFHTTNATMYMQVCTLVKCKHTFKSSCGLSATSSSTDFESITIKGSFHGPYIYPEVLLTDRGQLRLPRIDQWEHKGHVMRGSKFDYPLLSAALFSRVYSKDGEFPNEQKIQVEA